MDELAEAERRLASAGVQTPSKDIKEITRFISKASSLTREELDSVLDLAKRREKREPIERILGQAKFFDLEFELTENVFKPSFETETTAEYALIHAESLGGQVKILDLGTGTGCILISLLAKLPKATGVGVDINTESIELAKRNAQRHGVSDRATFQLSDWTNDIHEIFDIVISNPPRIPERLIPALVREVAEYDPKEALNGGKDGLLFYSRLAENFRRIAKRDAFCVIQAGDIIIEQAKKIFVKNGFSDVFIRRDYKYSSNCISFRNNEKIQLSFIEYMLKKFLSS